MALPKHDQNSPRWLLVEGQDDKGVCAAFLAHAALKSVWVEEKRGYETLRSSLAAEIKAPGRSHLGVVVDADDNVAGRWASLRDVVGPLGYHLPRAPQAGGVTVEAENLPRLGFWIMPDNHSTGMVEDFISALIPGDDPLMAHAVSAVDGILDEQRKFKPTYLRKAEVHTWLAWQEEPGRPMGQAIAKVYVDAAGDKAAPFLNWLKALYS